MESFLHRSILKEGDSPMADTEVLTRLLDSSLDPAPTDSCGRTPLHLVVQQGHYSASGVDELIHLLLNKGADLNAKDNAGETSLMYAAKAGYWAAAIVLLGRAPILLSKITRAGPLFVGQRKIFVER
jgi:ankyrin repeat protein